MPFKLHADAKKRLVETIAEVIPRMDVSNGKFLERGRAFRLLGEAEKVLPSNGATRDQLVSYVDEQPVTTFVTDSLSDELQAAEFLSDGPTKKLTELEGFDDPSVVAHRLVDGLQSLPHRYKLTIRLPAELGPIMQSDWRTEFSPDVSLVRASPELSELCPVDTSYPHANLGGLLSLLNPKLGWEEGAIYVQVEASGFIGIYGGSLPHDVAIRKLREFCGLGLALRLFKVDSRYTLATPPASLFLHRFGADNKWTLCDVDARYGS
jgi:hypothetical protein